MTTREHGIDSEWLTRRVSLGEAIRENMHGGIPFGHANEDWQRLLGKMEPGDELSYFEPPTEDSMRLWGLALVRGEEVISTVIIAVD